MLDNISDVLTLNRRLFYSGKQQARQDFSNKKKNFFAEMKNRR